MASNGVLPLIVAADGTACGVKGDLNSFRRAPANDYEDSHLKNYSISANFYQP